MTSSVKKPFLHIVKQTGWGLVSKKGGSLHCTTCKKLFQQAEYEHILEVRDSKISPQSMPSPAETPFVSSEVTSAVLTTEEDKQNHDLALPRDQLQMSFFKPL